MLAILAMAALAAPSSAGSPSFKLTSERGVYSFVRPDGQRFWSMGVCCVNEGLTKEQYQEDNPSYASFRLFANDGEWAQDTLSRLKSWNVNTLGGWSNPERVRIPYTVVLHLGAYYRGPWEDMFSPEFEAVCDKAAKDQIQKIASDPLLIGYFSDNEFGWWDDALFLTYLAMPATSPGKQKLIHLARTHYKARFDGFLKDWITDARCFDDLAKAGAKVAVRPGGKAMDLVNAWTYCLASRYYSVVKRAIRKYDKHRLILGDRYAQYWELPVLRAAAKYVDAISTNYGAEFLDGTLSHYYLATIYAATHKPVLISEFYWNAMENRSGNKNTVKAFPIVQTQEERARAFSVNLDRLLSLPFVVGAHWFQYYDEPEKGRADGEDGNMGLVDIYGKPYELMADVLSKHTFMGSRHTQDSLSSNLIPIAPTKPLDSLLHWPRDKGWIRPNESVAFGDLYTCCNNEYLYLGLHAMDFVYDGLYDNKTVPESERPFLDLSLNNKASIKVRFMAGRPATVDGPAGTLVAEQPGVKHVVILAIPWSSLGLSHQVTIAGTLYQHSKASRMSWKMTLAVNR